MSFKPLGFCSFPSLHLNSPVSKPDNMRPIQVYISSVRGGHGSDEETEVWKEEATSTKPNHDLAAQPQQKQACDRPPASAGPSLPLNKALSIPWGEAEAACVSQIPLPQHALSLRCTGKAIHVMNETRNYDLECEINLLSECVLGISSFFLSAT